MARKIGKSDISGSRPSSRAPVNGRRAPSGGRAASRGSAAELKATRRRHLLVALVSALGLLMGATMIALNLVSVVSSTQAPVGNNPDAQLERRTKGNPNAPVVINEWFDFQCPACRVFTLTREPEIVRLYVDTGKVRYVARNFAFLGIESFLAAEAAEAAADQGRYWDYYRLLFQRQLGENVGSFTTEKLKSFASELGLDRQKFDAALDQRVYRAAVLAEQREGEALGVRATPSFFVNGQLIRGVPTVEQLGKVIDQEMAKKQ